MKKELTVELLNENYVPGAAVVMIWANEKYLIWKFKELLAGSEALEEQLLAKKTKYLLRSLKKTDLFYKLVKHITDYNLKKIMIEVLFRSEQPQELLLKETYYLNTYADDDNRLNINTQPYMPAWMSPQAVPEPIKQLFHFELRGRHRADPAIVKLIVGEKYLIWKFKSINQGMQSLNKSFNSKLRNGFNELDLFGKLIKHVVATGITTGTVEVLLKTKDIAQLYELEAALLKEKDSNRLNINKKPYVPEWMKPLKKLKPKTFANG